MKKNLYLSLAVGIAVFLVGVNIISKILKPITILLNLVLVGALITFIVLYALEVKKEKYDPNAYNYDRENPNALISGRVVGGSVYAAYPQNAPGLGWIL
jgi:hypothetical protein